MKLDPDPRPPRSFVDEARDAGHRQGLATGFIGGFIAGAIVFPLLIAAFGG